MTDQTNEVMASFYRCRRDRNFLDTFYSVFLAKSPEIGEMFAETDFKIQKLVLRQSLLEMICFDRGMHGTREEIDRLGHRHKELGVTAEMYSMWLDALCEAIAQHDEQYSSDLEQTWRKAMRKSIDEMIAIGVSEVEE